MKPASRQAKRGVSGAVDVVVIGAGHSGLAMSHFLSARSIEHVVLERGEVANSWRNERWDSLRLLTPNWLTSLPGMSYSGPEPDAFMSMPEVIRFISDYASLTRAPVHPSTAVVSVETAGDGWRVDTDNGRWHCRAVVAATGACNLPLVPAASKALPAGIRQLTAHEYRNPQQLAPGGVLVVGASASGMQVADEIRRAGHEVTIAVGEHVRMPRTYRGRDILWWMQASGLSDQGYLEADDLTRARRVPSPQLVGSHEQRFMDLNALSALGIRVAGRLAGVRDAKVQFSGSLRNICALADLKMNRLLATIDDWAEQYGGAAGPVERFEPTRVPEPPCLGLDLRKAGIRTVIWATGYRPDYSWLKTPVFDRQGQVRHDGGIAEAPGLYVLGLPFLRRRKSSFIHGAADDARDLSGHLAAFLAARTADRAVAPARR